MARRTKVEAEQTRKALLETALRLFSERGVAQTTLKEIAIETGVTHGALYWHFKNKTDLLKALYENCRLPLDQLQLEQLQAARQDGIKALENFLLQWCMLLYMEPRNSSIWRVFHQGRQQVAELEPLQSLIVEEQQQWLGRIHAFVKKARKQKQLCSKLKGQADAVAAHLMMLVFGLINSSLELSFLDDPQHVFKPVIQTYLKGMKG